MNNENLLERIIDDFSKIDYRLSESAMSEGLTEFFKIYQTLNSEEEKNLLLEKSSKLMGWKYKEKIKQIYEFGNSLTRIKDASLSEINFIDNLLYLFKLNLENEHPFEWIENEIKNATGNFYLDKEDRYNLIKRGLLTKNNFLFISGENEVIAVLDNIMPF